MPKAVFNSYATPEDNPEYDYDYNRVGLKIKGGVDFKTNHLSHVSMCFDRGYEIFFVDLYGVEYPLKNDGSLTPKDIRPAHNIFKMLVSGCFCNPKVGRYFTIH